MRTIMRRKTSKKTKYNETIESRENGQGMCEQSEFKLFERGIIMSEK